MNELTRRILFLLLAIVIYRFGSYIPVPGIDTASLLTYFNQQAGTALGFFNAFSGGSLARSSIFALGVIPYISASIIMQLLSVVVPHLEELRKQGEQGRHVITQYTRYLTLVLAIIESFAIARYIVSIGVVPDPTLSFYILSAIILTTGTIFLVWLGEQVNERGIGNGISMLIFAGILSGVPSSLARTFAQSSQGVLSPIALLFIAAVVLFAFGFVVFVELAQRKILLRYVKRRQGRRLAAPQDTFLPLKVNLTGVIPAIFASSLLIFPSTLAVWFGSNIGWLQGFSRALEPGQPVYILVFSAAVLFFSFFYASIMFDSKDTASNLQRTGAFIPGIRPGTQTASAIQNVLNRLTVIGSLYVISICLLPLALLLVWNVPFYFGGTSLLIVAVVVMDLIQQIQAHIMSGKYSSIMRYSGRRRT